MRPFFKELKEKLRDYLKPQPKRSKLEELKQIYERVELPERTRPFKPISWEYREFKRATLAERLPRTLYEKLCWLCEKLLPVDPDENTRKRMERAIKLAHLRITPRGAASLTLLSCGALSSLAFLLILSNLLFGFGLSLGYGLLLIALSVPLSYYLYTYPMRLERRFLARIGSELTLMILYMVIYLRDSPNLEGAVEFASRNLSGELADDLRKLLWDLEVGKYATIDEALIDYLLTWKTDRYFIEAIQLMRTALKEPEEKREVLLNETIDLVLSGTHDRAKEFSQQLKLPVMLIHALGILLPVMGLVMFPIIGIFLEVKGEILLIGYDVILPIVLYFFMSNVLETRPSTTAELSIGMHPEMPPQGKFTLGKFYLPILPFALLAGLPFFAAFLASYNAKSMNNLFPSLLFTLGMLSSLVTYFFLASFQRAKLRNEIRKIEGEFTEALFQLGNQVSTGIPIERAIERARENVGELSIKNFFDKILQNMRNLGMTFREAIFDPQHGAILYYPSSLIKSIMRIVCDAAKRGTEAASLAMLTISRHLKNIADTHERIQDMLSDVLSSLRFQALLLTPVVAGIIVTMATVIIGILNKLSTAVRGAAAGAGYIAPFLPWGNLNITPGEFQLIVAIYFLESTLLITSFSNWIQNGEDPIARDDQAWKTLLIGGIVYFFVLIASYVIFAPLAMGLTL